MQDTGIIWTEKTWNPMSGCQKISQGCKYCYAYVLAEKKRGSPAFPNGFDLTLRPKKLTEPLKLKDPALIFVNSTSDLFWDEVPESYRHQILDIIEQTPQHEYQVLTKRPEKMFAFSKERRLPPNFWAGVSIEHRDTLSRLEILKKIQTEIHFISFEPLIGPVNLTNADLAGIDWAITGGESGIHLWDEAVAEKRALVRYNKAAGAWEPREDRVPWVRAIKDACIESKVHFFHKQWGGHYPEAGGRLLDGQFWTAIPRLPGQRKTIDNEYLKLIEGRKDLGSSQGELL
jgi:protein gp37